MDAKVGDYVVTPRNGKQVEINAMWYNALMITAELAEKFEDDVDIINELKELANNTKNHLMKNFTIKRINAYMMY